MVRDVRRRASSQRVVSQTRAWPFLDPSERIVSMRLQVIKLEAWGDEVTEYQTAAEGKSEDVDVGSEVVYRGGMRQSHDQRDGPW